MSLISIIEWISETELGKFIDLDIFPSFMEYINEEEQKITRYGDNIELITVENCNYLVLNKNESEIINQITQILK